MKKKEVSVTKTSISNIDKMSMKKINNSSSSIIDPITQELLENIADHFKDISKTTNFTKPIRKSQIKK